MALFPGPRGRSKANAINIIDSDDSDSTLSSSSKKRTRVDALDVEGLTIAASKPSKRPRTHLAPDAWHARASLDIAFRQARPHMISQGDSEDSTTTIDLDSGSEIESNHDDQALNLIRDLSPFDARQFEHAYAHREALPRGHKYLHSARTHLGIVVQPEMGVSLIEDEHGRVHFLWVKSVVQSGTGEVYVEGISLKRHQYIFPGDDDMSILPNSRNDLCMDLKTTPEKLAVPSSRECWIRVDLNNILCERTIVFTNYAYPKFSYHNQGSSSMSTLVDKKVCPQALQRVLDHGVLCCRWKFASEIADKRRVGGQLMWLNQKECDAGKALPEVERRRQYGKSTSKAEKIKAITLADLCAGGGGTSRAGKMAGLSLEWVLDNWKPALKTLEMNFPGTKVLKHSIQDFVMYDYCLEEDYSVDTMHISFPCQGHSHRNKGTNPEKDMENNATVMVLTDLLTKLQPRVVTLEQTNGILSKNNGYWFRVVLAHLSTAGYNWRWRVINMGEHEVPHDRCRLMIYATCPGQELPNWPAPTHGDGLLPKVTIRDAIQGIPEDDHLHNIELHKELYRIGKGRQKLDVAEMDRPLRLIIDTGGAQALFRDRDGTIYWPSFRQQMCLQTFPHTHFIYGRTQKEILTQIGNAVPCIFMKAIFQEVKKAIKKADRETKAWDNEVVQLD